MRSLAVLLALSTTLPAQIQRIDPNGLAKPTRYAHVVVAKAEKTIYVAGQIGVNASGQLVAKGDLVAQAEQAFSNVETALTAAGATFADVVKMNIYIVGLKPGMMAAIRPVRDRYIKGPWPAGTAVGVQSLISEDALIEIEVIAVR